MKLATSEMEAETERWQEGMVGEGGPNVVDENNDIVKRARNMSRMAFSMYQFTRGEGPLKTTQDLFTQAEYFAEEANRLYKVVRQFSYQVIFFCCWTDLFRGDFTDGTVCCAWDVIKLCSLSISRSRSTLYISFSL